VPPGRSILSRLCLLLVLAAPPLSAARNSSDPVVVQDPQYGEVLFYFYQEEYFPAIVRLLAARDQKYLEHHADDAELLLGGLYLSYGQHLESAAIFQELLGDNVDQDVRDRTWFFLAKIWYQRGYLDKSRQALANIKGNLPDNLQREALMLDAQILIDDGQYDAAIARLSNWKGQTEWASYAKFNIGVALVRSGRVQEAENVLDELGTLNPYNDELSALRDKANLALGYALLQDGQPQAGKSKLQRVRLDGPFSNKALLGVGWADAETGNFQSALVPWMELRDRDLLDPAVQESMLAIPYGLAELDAISQAADNYLNAIEAFRDESGRLDRAIRSIEDGEFFEQFIADDPLDSTGWYWRLDELPTGIEGRYLYRMLASHEFQEGLKNYRDLFFLHQNLDRWQGNVDVFANMLETRKEAYLERLPRVEEALARADIDGMVNRKLEYDATLNSIESSHDWLALATESEFEMWGEISGLEAAPALDADIPEAAEVRDKIALIKGVLQWQLEKDFRERLWRVRRDLRDTGEALVVTQRSRRQIDQTMQDEPLNFERLSDRVYGLAPGLEGMKMRVEDTLARQGDFLKSIAVGDLLAQKQRLDTYMVQARFALAAIYDIAGQSGEEGE